MIDAFSPNCEPRPPGQAIDMLVIHYTGMATTAEALERLRDPRAKVSAHYLIDEDGCVLHLVPEELRAWHAGVSCWRGARNINDRSIGIELANPGHEFGYRPFPGAQMDAFRRLALDIIRRHSIPARNIVGHSDVAPSRKQDPGELFDWKGLANSGIGLWPFGEAAQPPRSASDMRSVLSCLLRIGYDVPPSAIGDERTVAAIRAFQRHFHPERLDGELELETVRRIRVLSELMT